MQQIVTHKGKQYTVLPLSDGNHWRLSEVEPPHFGFTLNREHMVLAGFGHVEGVES